MICIQINKQRVLRFNYELVKKNWRFPYEFAMIGLRYGCKIVEVGNRPIQGKIDQQYDWLRHYSLKYLSRIFFILGK